MLSELTQGGEYLRLGKVRQALLNYLEGDTGPPHLGNGTHKNLGADNDWLPMQDPWMARDIPFSPGVFQLGVLPKTRRLVIIIAEAACANSRGGDSDGLSR
jgi:hypothetical protein